MPKGIVRVMVEGMQRARLISMQEAKGYLAGEIELLEEEAYDLDRNTELAMQRALQDLLKRYAQMNQKFGKELLGSTAGARCLEELVEAGMCTAAAALSGTAAAFRGQWAVGTL